MDSEKIGKLIKQIRQDNNLTQKQFAEKYNVSFQAVSKWETGKNIPDIALLKQMSNDFNFDLNELLDGKKSTKKRSYKRNTIIIIIMVIILLFLAFLYHQKTKGNDFQLDRITSECKDFNISGSVAYNDNKTSIYISDINYCGNDYKEKYDKIECILYESVNGKDNKISSAESTEPTTIQEFLPTVRFNVDNFNRSCDAYSNGNLYIDIIVTLKEDTKLSHKVPLNLSAVCENQ